MKKIVLETFAPGSYRRPSCGVCGKFIDRPVKVFGITDGFGRIVLRFHRVCLQNEIATLNEISFNQ